MPLLHVDPDVPAKSVATAPTGLAWLLGDCDVMVPIRTVDHGLNPLSAAVDHGCNPLSDHGFNPLSANPLSAVDHGRNPLCSPDQVDPFTTTLASGKIGAGHKVASPHNQTGSSASKASGNGKLDQADPLTSDDDVVEESEPKAESSKEVLVKDNPEHDFLSTTIALNGETIMCKGSPTAKEPWYPEELRAKLKLIATCWMFLKLKHSNRPWLDDITPKKFRDAIV